MCLPKGGWGSGDFHIYRRWWFWYLQGCSTSKGPQPELFLYLLVYCAKKKKKWPEIMYCFRIGISWGWKTFLNHTHKTGSWYFLGVLFKISDKHHRPFYMGVSPGLFTSVLTGSLHFLCPLWLAKVANLVLDFQYSIENSSIPISVLDFL